MNAYEAQRLENIKKNQALIRELGIKQVSNDNSEKRKPNHRPPSKRQKLDVQPSRVSARIASTASRPTTYNEDELTKSSSVGSRSKPQMKGRGRKSHKILKQELSPPPKSLSPPTEDVVALQDSWSSWTSVAPPPTRDDTTKVFHFESHPDFTPNKSPAEVLREGCFGGSYFRPLYSRKLGIKIKDDWQELPESWKQGLKVEKFLASPEYDAEVNKFKVACGQSIEEWEAAGWIDHRHDVRGWFQWYCRFFLGRRCDDDDRQVGRWRRCVGESGRWRRALLKKYVAVGVRDCFDDGEEGEDAPEVSPVMHQTCHHWAFEVRQPVLDEFWRTGK